jgi:hypothetical protein
MRYRTTKFQSLFFVLLASLTFNLAAQDKQQNRNQNARTSDLYVVSAKAGGVNYISGKVYVTRSESERAQALAIKDQLNDRDKVLTGETGKVEILLNPGSFLRLAENSEIEFTDVTSDDLKLTLNRGSALIEATTFDKDGAGIVVATPAGTVSFAKSGIYRINVLQNDTVAISVWKGAAKSGNILIKAKHKVVLRNNVATEEIAKLENENRDGFELWSKDRAKELAKLNESLRQRELSRALMAFNRTGMGGFRNGFGSNSGAWIFDTFRGSYCFLPFYVGAWNSPYGFGYNNYASFPGSAGYNNGAIIRPSAISQPNTGMPNFPGSGGGNGAASPSNPMPSQPSPETRSNPSRIFNKDLPTNPN